MSVRRTRGRPVVGVLAVICLSALALMTRPAAATFPGSNGKIAFMNGEGTDTDLYIMDPDGTNAVRIAQGAGGSMSWSPDGRRLAFRADRDGRYGIYVIDANGAHERRVSDDPAVDGEPDWLPDGRRIAFTRVTSPTDKKLFVVDAETGRNLHMVLDNAEASNWSPDGMSVAFDRDGVIYVANADGTAAHPVTSSGFDYEPHWSPDGRRIAFSSDRTQPHPGSGATDVYVMDADGRNVTRLTTTGGAGPEWSPDGTKIAFDTEDLTVHTYLIYVMDASGANRTRVSPSPPIGHLFPAWQPAGPGPCCPGPPGPHPSTPPPPARPPVTSAPPPSVGGPVATATTASAPAGAAAPLSVSQKTVRAGERLTLSGDGFAPHGDLTVTFRSRPTVLASTEADDAGNFSMAVRIPPHATPGLHRVVVAGPGPTEGPRQQAAEIRVAGGHDRDWWPVVLFAIAAAIVAAVAAAAVRSRRRRSDPAEDLATR